MKIGARALACSRREVSRSLYSSIDVMLAIEACTRPVGHGFYHQYFGAYSARRRYWQ